MTYSRDELLQKMLLRAGRPLPDHLRKRCARRVRGWIEARQIARASAVVLSHAKSGRTWLATMLSAYERAAGVSLDVFFSHDNYIRDWAAGGATGWSAEECYPFYRKLETALGMANVEAIAQSSKRLEAMSFGALPFSML